MSQDEKRAAVEERPGMSLIGQISRSWPVVVAGIALGAGGGLLITKLTRPVFMATATVEFDSNAVRALGEKGTDGLQTYTNFLENQSATETQFKIMTSDRVLSRVVMDLGLTKDADFLGVSSRATLPIPVTDAVNVLRSRLIVESVRGTRLFTVKVEDTQPRRAKQVCDVIVATYLTQNAEKLMSATSEAAVWLNGQVDHYEKQLVTNENAIHEFKSKNSLPSTSINETSNMLRLEMEAYAEALAKTRTEKQAVSARAKELANVSPDRPDLLPSTELLKSDFMSSLRGQYMLAQKELGEQVAVGKGDNHPLFKRAADRFAQAKAALLTEVQNIQGALERDLAVYARREAGEAALFEDARRRAVDLNMKQIEYHRLDRSREQNEKLYGMLIERMKQADLARMMTVSNVRLLDESVEPKVPIRPRGGANLGIGALAGLLLGLVAAWARTMLDNSIKTPEDVETKLGMPFLGLLPDVGPGGPKGPRRTRRRNVPGPGEGVTELVVHQWPTSGVAEAARTVRTNLMFMRPDRPYRTLIVSSSAPGEGKTTVACSLSIAFAQSGRRVCIVDCDLRRPRLHRLFDRVGDPGVTSVLMGECSAADVAKPTMVENLYCIPAGTLPPNPADLFHSKRFRAFVDELKDMFDLVVFDSPPLVPVTDSAIISTLMDGCVFVTRAFKTSSHLSRQGLRALRDVDAPVIGVVLNAVDLNRHEYSYRYYYYYKKDGYKAVPVSKAESAGASPPAPLN